MRDRSAGGFDHRLAPGRSPAGFNVAGKRWRFRQVDPLAEERSKNAVDQPPRSAIDQRQGGGDQRMIGGAEPGLLGEREPENHPRLAVVRQTLPGRAVDQRVEVGESTQRFPRNRGCQRGIDGRQGLRNLGGCVHRVATPQDRVEDLKGGGTRGKAFRGWHQAL